MTIDDDDVFKVIFVKIFSDLRKFCSTLTRAILFTFYTWVEHRKWLIMELLI